jgi:hypothetical protein
MRGAVAVLLIAWSTLAKAEGGDASRRLVVVAADKREVVQLHCGDVLAVRLFSLPVLPPKKAAVIDARASNRSLHFIGRAPVAATVEGSTSEEAFFAAVGAGENDIEVRLRTGSRTLRSGRLSVVIDCGEDPNG